MNMISDETKPMSASSSSSDNWSYCSELNRGDYDHPPTSDQILRVLFLGKKIDIANCTRLAKGRYSKIITAKIIRDNKSNSAIAMKVINTSKVPAWYMENILSYELYHWRQLSHPNVLELLGHYEALHYVFLTMELASKGDMQRWVEQNGIVVEVLLRAWTLQLISGIGYMHEQGIPHQNLVPKNILLNRWDQIKVSNFGMIDNESGNTAPGSPLCYRAPEILEKTINCDRFKADVWSLGCCMFYMATGRHPFPEDCHLAILVSHQSRHLYTMQPAVSDHCRRSIDALLSYDPAYRPTMLNCICLPFFN